MVWSLIFFIKLSIYEEGCNLEEIPKKRKFISTFFQIRSRDEQGTIRIRPVAFFLLKKISIT